MIKWHHSGKWWYNPFFSTWLTWSFCIAAAVGAILVAESRASKVITQAATIKKPEKTNTLDHCFPVHLSMKPSTQILLNRMGIPHWTVLKRLGFWGQNLSLYAIIAQHTVHCKGHMIVLAKDILKLEKITLKVGKNWNLCSDFGQFWKSTRTHRYSYTNLMGRFYGVHRCSRKKNWARVSMVRFWPCSLASGLLALIFLSKCFSNMVFYLVVPSISI